MTKSCALDVAYCFVRFDVSIQTYQILGYHRNISIAVIVMNITIVISSDVIAVSIMIMTISIAVILADMLLLNVLVLLRLLVWT